MRAWWFVLAGCSGAATGDAGPHAQVYVEFDAIALTQGAADDATRDQSSAPVAGTLTRYLDTKADRDARIGTVLDGLDAILAPFAIDVVTERPSIGNYDMIVIAGMPAEVGIGTGAGGIAAIDCSNAVPNKLVVVFGNAFPDSFTGDQMASLAVAGLGVSQGMPSSDLKDDCLCWTGEHCANTKRCTFGGPDTPIAANDPCAMGAATMDSMAEFTRVFHLQ